MTVDHEPGGWRASSIDLDALVRRQIEEDDAFDLPAPVPHVRVAAISVYGGDPAALAAEIISSVTPHVASATWGIGRVEAVIEPADPALATAPLSAAVLRWSSVGGDAEVDATSSSPLDWERLCYHSTSRIARALIPDALCQCGFGAVPPPDACDCHVAVDHCSCHEASPSGSDSAERGCLVAPDSWPQIRRRLAEQALAIRSRG